MLLIGEKTLPYYGDWTTHKEIGDDKDFWDAVNLVNQCPKTFRIVRDTTVVILGLENN